MSYKGVWLEAGASLQLVVELSVQSDLKQSVWNLVSVNGVLIASEVSECSQDF